MIRRSLDVYREQGPTSLVVKGGQFVRNRCRTKAMAALDPIYKWALPDTIELTLGETAVVFDSQAASLAADFRYSFETERAVIDDMLATVGSTDTFYDVGANVGVYSCFVGRSVPEATVVAFEPHPEEAAVLERNFEHNGLSVDRIHRYALSNVAGPATIHTAFEGAGHVLVDEGGPPGRRYEIERQVGDEYVTERGLPTPTVVKVDVEGMERKVLDGLSETIAREDCRVVYAEYHPQKSDCGEADLADRLEGAGFEVSVLDQRQVGGNNQKHLKATKAT